MPIADRRRTLTAAAHLQRVHLQNGVLGREDDGLDVVAEAVALHAHHVLHLLLDGVVVVDEAHAAHLRVRACSKQRRGASAAADSARRRALLPGPLAGGVPARLHAWHARPHAPAPW